MNLGQYVSVDEKISLFTAKEKSVFIKAVSDSAIPPKMLDNGLLERILCWQPAEVTLIGLLYLNFLKILSTQAWSSGRLRI